MKKILVIFLLSTFSLFGKVEVVTTIPDYASLTKEIGGEHVNVQYLVQPTQDPHFADPLPSHIVKLNQADLVVHNGAGLESGWLPSVLKQARNSKIVSEHSIGNLNASHYVTLKEIQKESDRSAGDVHPEGNPHFYTSPIELFKIGKEISKRLQEIDPKNRECYKKNWDIFEQKYNTKMVQWIKIAEKIKGKKVVVYHESWIYLLEWLSLSKRGALEPKPGVPPTTKHILSLLKHIESEEISFVMQELYHPTNLSSMFAKKSKSKLLVLPSMTDGSIWDKFDSILEKLSGEKI